jgi:hypothetical protein
MFPKTIVPPQGPSVKRIQPELFEEKPPARVIRRVYERNDSGVFQVANRECLSLVVVGAVSKDSSVGGSWVRRPYRSRGFVTGPIDQLNAVGATLDFDC